MACVQGFVGRIHIGEKYVSTLALETSIGDPRKIDPALLTSSEYVTQARNALGNILLFGVLRRRYSTLGTALQHAAIP
jgi:hypothetical protein